MAISVRIASKLFLSGVWHRGVAVGCGRGEVAEAGVWQSGMKQWGQQTVHADVVVFFSDLLARSTMKKSKQIPATSKKPTPTICSSCGSG